jgi:hypothetical protein
VCVHVRYFAVIIINQSGLMGNKMKPKAAAAAADEAGILAMVRARARVPGVIQRQPASSLLAAAFPLCAAGLRFHINALRLE